MPFLTATKTQQDPPEVTFNAGELGRDLICAKYGWTPEQLQQLRSASLFPSPYATKIAVVGPYLLPQQCPVWTQQQVVDWEAVVKGVLLATFR